MRGERSGWLGLCSRLSRLLVLCLLVLLPAVARAQEAPQQWLVYANTDVWKTDVVASTYLIGQPTTLAFSDCPFGAMPKLRLEGGQTRLVQDLAAWQCSGQPVGLAPLRVLTGGHERVASIARFADAAGNVATFEIPPLRYALFNFPAQVTQIQNDGTWETALILFNQGTRSATIALTTIDEHDTAVGVQVVDAAPGMSIHPLHARVRIGRVELRQGSQVGCIYCNQPQPIYGFAAVGWRRGGSQRIRPLEQVLYATEVH